MPLRWAGEHRRRPFFSCWSFERGRHWFAIGLVLTLCAGLLQILLLASASSASASPTETPPEPTAEELASQEAEESGSLVEVTERTSETIKLTAMPDGTFEYETSPVPVRVKRDGAFHDADLTLENSGGSIASRMSVNGVTFGADGSDVLATMTRDGKSLTLTWGRGSLPEPVIDGSSATYVDAGGTGIDVVVRSTPTGWSHYVVVRTPEAAQDPGLARIVFGVRGNGLTLQERSDDRVVAVDSEGTEVFTAPEPLMWEGTETEAVTQTSPEEIAAGPAPQSASQPMEAEVTSGSLALIPDQNLLTAPDTRFPIVIDPSWQTWNGGREGDDGHTGWGPGWAYVDRTWPDSNYWKPDRLPTGREVEDYTDKRSYIRMDTSPLHQWSGNVKVKVDSVSITFDTLHAWSCTKRDVRLFNVDHIYSSTTWNTRPGAYIPAGSGWANNWLSTAPVNVGRPECGDGGSSNDVRFVDGHLTRLMQWATDNRWDFFTLGLFPDKDYDDTHTWKVMDVDPRMVVKFSRVPMPVKDVHMRNGGTTKYACTQGEGRPWVGTSPAKDRTLRAKITDYDGDASGGYDGQPLRAQYELAPLGQPGASWYQYSPSNGGYQQSEPDGYLHASFTTLHVDNASGPDGGTNVMWRVRGQDDTGLSGPWSAWCEFTVDGKRPVQPMVSSPQYPSGQTSGYDAANRKYETGTFTLAPGSSNDVVKFHYRFKDGAEGTKTVAAGAQASFGWTPQQFGWQWVEVTSFDRAGNTSPTVKYEFGVEQPPRDAAWSMDEEAGGTVAHAVGDSGQARPNADIAFPAGVTMGQSGNQGTAVPSDLAFQLNGSSQYGEVVPVLDSDPAGEPVSLVNTSQRFMFSTWVKLASTTGDQIAISQQAADDSVFELGWIGGKWTFRHRKADGTVIAAASRDIAQPSEGWSNYWVSLMGGYDHINKKIWLRTQTPGHTMVCVPPGTPNCWPQDVMPEKIDEASSPSWTPMTGKGSLLYGASVTASGAKTSYWNGWIDDSQLWPLAAPDDSVLFVIYNESVQDREFAGRTLRLVNVNSGHCLDVANSGLENQANVIQGTCNASVAQDWQFTEVGNGYYTLTNPHSGKCLDVDGTDGSGTADGRNVWQYDCNGSDGQKWTAEKKARGYWLTSKRSGKCLTVDGASEAAEANVVQWACQDPLVNNQMWNITAQKLHELHGVTYRLRNAPTMAASDEKCLETASAPSPTARTSSNGSATAGCGRTGSSPTRATATTR
ncbi:hypothetical protein BJF79_07435 [Actinomadura sp. CNU-125]|nr:RICIN domain-containing protein [Actinomadura sp. CNU-125]OLT34391.1 hypothetical protein BJF79_07435 [Actinomadura sp. CNU-125]